jgi:hypothetical protein
MNFKKWVKSIQTAGYNGARTVHKIPKFIQNSAKVHRNKPIKRNKNILSIERKNLGLGQIFWPKD